METKLRILRGGVVNWLTRSMLYFHIWLMRYLKRSRNFHSRANSATLSEGAVQSLRGVVVMGVETVQVARCYLRPVRGCTSGGWVTHEDTGGPSAAVLGLLTFVLDLANSRRMVWGRSGSNLTPCCNKTLAQLLSCAASVPVLKPPF